MPSGPSGTGAGSGGSATAGPASITWYTRSAAARVSWARMITDAIVRAVVVIVVT